MTNREYRAILEKLAIPVIGAAEILGISPRQAQRYAAADAIPGPVARLMRLLADGTLQPHTLKDMA